MINWDRVNELRDEVGIEDFQEVIVMFLEEVENTMVRMIAIPNLATLEEDMHFLKGSALNLGFAHFADLCQVGEKAAGSGQAETIFLDDIFESYAASKTAFRERFGCMKAA
ncbi:MAG: histidine kinase [Marinosulfonomonas sp.]|nr:MAG: histidine kinase [Marinosulfonomonas sp.]